MGPPDVEIERRRPVWIALSELYLDTELQPADRQLISDAIVDSGYTIDDIEHILCRELGPVLGMNMLSAAGEWEAFDPDWLVSTVLQRLTSWRHHLPSFTAFSMIQDQWEPIRHLVETKQATSPRSEKD